MRMICQHCKKKKEDVKRRRQRTAYHNNEDNFAILCSLCQQEADEYWQEQWDEYYGGLL